jgi:hypothetical protein
VSVKLLMTWDIIPGREQEYFEFVVREFLPSMQRLGLETNDSWFTLHGNQPKIMVAAQMPSLVSMQNLLKTEDWNSLVSQLMDYIENYQLKIIPASGGFQL